MGHHHIESVPSMTLIEIIACCISSVACFVLVVYLAFARQNKIHYRLSIGLLVSLFVTNVICVVMPLLPKEITNDFFYATHLTALTVSFLYTASIFLHYLLKSLRYTEVRLGKIDIAIHVTVWLLAFLYILCIAFFPSHSISSLALLFNLGILAILSIFIVVSTICIITRQRRDIAKFGEMKSPLLQNVVSFASVAKFQVRLIMLMILALTTGINVPLIVFLTYQLHYGKQWAENVLDVAVAACAITGLCVTVLMASAPEIKRLYRNRLSSQKMELNIN